MPAVVPLSPSAKATTSTSRSQPQSKKTRIVRRRGRAKNAIESDDEIEREVGTDSESDDQSSLDSATDSDTEPASEDVVPNGHLPVRARSASQSLTDVVSVNGQAFSKPSALVNDEQASFFGVTGNWSEMVADENVNGPADLPVIDFQDFDGHPLDQRLPSSSRSRKPIKAAKKPTARTASVPVAASIPVHPDSPEPTSVKEEHADYVDDKQPFASTSKPPSDASNVRRPAGQSARQAYQQRLESDPSYVPTVGEFWGHDDRLLDKDLRSLSGWWRGRWQGRGRGRGGFDRGFSMRGRGRGGFFGQPSVRFPNSEASQSIGDEQIFAEHHADLPPVEKQWTHDGFEEMKRREEQRRASQEHSNQPPPPARGGLSGFHGGRGGFVGGRGRGGFARGGFSPSPTVRARPHLPFSPPAGRPWFAMKPERMWTKQYDGFLYLDPALKSRHGHGPGYRVKLPGEPGRVIRAPPLSYHVQSPSRTKPFSASVHGSEDGEKFVVRLPKRAGKEKAVEPILDFPALAAPESFTTVDEPPIEDVFTVRPQLQARGTIRDPQIPASSIPNGHAVVPSPSNIAPQHSSSGTAPPLFVRNTDVAEPLSVLPEQILRQQPGEVSVEQKKADQLRWTQAEEAVLRHPLSEHRAEDVEVPSRDPRPVPPTLPPLQTSFSPVPQTSPPYGSPYGYGSALPPGIGVSQHGMPYELSTGRPVYFQPPPPHMYNPQPVHNHMAPLGMHFTPGHMHHQSAVSPDFLAPPHTPPVNGFVDPSTGAPIFVPPRQRSRIEIRAPTEQTGGKLSAKSERRPSGLRTTAVAFEPSRSEADQHGGYFPDTSEQSANETPYVLRDEEGQSQDGQQPRVMDPAVMAYSPYQQQYYYPEPYGYAGYVDVSQVAQYDMYHSDPHAPPQGTIYY